MAGPGGKREGAGRKPGGMNARTLERMAMKRHFVERILKSTDKLFNAQLDKAIGEKYLMCKRTEYGPKGAIRREWHEIVTDPETILKYLDSTLDSASEDDSLNDPMHFYYLTTKPADNMAIANMLDRAYGKPTEKVELKGEDDGDLSELSDEALNGRIDEYLRRRQSRS